MSSKACPKCHAPQKHFKKYGRFKRKSDSKLIQRYKCSQCLGHFSSASFSPCYKQNKRRLNPVVKKLLCSSVSMRRAALFLGVSRTTIKRKLDFLSAQAKLKHEDWMKKNLHKGLKYSEVQFDDLETFEHTKLKPITVTMVVSQKKRKVLGYRVSSIGAKGLLAELSRKKYGKRRNDSFKNRDELFKSLKAYIDKKAIIASDESTHYPKVIKKHFPEAIHKRYKGVRGCVSGQGELKKLARDPLFSINHSFAMLRANVNRLVRKTWCTTKKLECLEKHLALYVEFHNQVLTD